MNFNSFYFIILVLLFNPFVSLVINNILNLPNIISLVKDLLIILFFIKAIRKKNIAFNKNVLWASLLLGLFVVLYLVISIFQNKLSAGLYFARLYILPLLFFIALQGIFYNLNEAKFKQYIIFLLKINYLVLFIAFILYFYSLYSEDFLDILFQGNVASAWRISLANFIRMGFPAAGPNVLAVYLVSNIFLVFVLFINGKTKFLEGKINLVFLSLLNVFALACTFSRSGFVFLIVAIFIVMVYKIKRLRMMYVKYFIIGIGVVVGLGIITDVYSAGKLSKWISSNLSFEDPSLKGHSLVFVEPIERFYDYYLLGYEKGTVGPRAQLFSTEIINVENSIIIILYDMGIFISLILFLAYYFLIRNNLVNIYQFGFLVGLFLNIQFLPTVYETEILMYCMIIFLLLIYIQSLNKSKMRSS